MLKRIMSVLLVLTMLLATAVTTLTVSAATATTTSSYNLAYFGGELPGTTAITSGSNFKPTTSISTKTMALSGSGSVQSVLHSDSTTDYYIANSNTILKYLPRTAYNIYAHMGDNYSGGKHVLSASYDLMIPDGTNANAERTFEFFLSAASNADAKSFLVVTYADGVFSVDNSTLAGIDETTVVSTTASYNAGNWTTVEVRAYLDSTTNKLTFGVYIGEKQIFYGAGTLEYTSLLRLWDQAWKQGSGVTTNIDDISFCLLEDADKPVTFTTETPDPDPEPEPEPEVVITDLNVIDFDDLTTTAATNELTVASESLLSNPKALTHSSTTNRSTEYVGETREDNGMALVVTTSTTTLKETDPSKNTVMVHQPKRHFVDYVNEDGKEYIISSSYEIYVPEASKESERKHTFTFSGVNNTDADCMLASYIKDGKLNFGLDILTENTKLTDFTERAKTAELPSDVWNKITYIMKIKYDTSNKLYDINLYGIYDEKCWYESAFKLDVAETNDKGLYMLIQGLTITGLDDKAVVTKYDNIKIASYSAIPEITYAWTDSENYIYPLAINTVEGGVEAKARIVGTYENLCLVTAVYNANGKLEKLWTDTTLEDGYLSYTVIGSDYIKSGYKVKTFLFDSITSAIPYVENVGLVIE